MAPITAKVRAVFDKISKVIYNMDMKFSKDVLQSKGITYNQKYPYGELAKVTKNKKRPHKSCYTFTKMV